MVATDKFKEEKSMLGPEGVKAWVEAGPSDKTINEIELFAKRIAHDLPKEQQVATAQIRQIFAKMKVLEAKGGIKVQSRQVDFLMLKPQIAYAAGRHKKTGLNELKDRLIEGIEAVLRADPGDNQQQRFKNFCLLFEAILSYHKAHGGN